MASKSVHVAGISTHKFYEIMLRISFLFLLGITCLTLAEADRVQHSRKGFEHAPANFFYFKDSNSVLYHDVSGDVYVSSDAGGSWNLADIPSHKTILLIQHSFANNKAYALTNEHEHYKTSDYGASWQKFKLPYLPVKKSPLSFHAKREGHLLFRGTKCVNWECVDVTYYTTDGFDTEPKLLLENTEQCIWAHSTADFDEAPDNSIYCIKYEVSGSGSMRTLSDYRLVESENFFETNVKVDFNTGGDVSGVIGLGTVKKYLVAAVKDINSFDMKLYVSTDGLSWKRAIFPLGEGPTHKHAQENAYTILESSTSHLVVDLLSSDSYNTGGLFFSNSEGYYFINRLNYTNRNNLGQVDFEAVQGVGGILLANIVSNHKDVDDGRAIAKRLQSMISFEDGARWRFIKPPEKNFGGVGFKCTGNWDDGTCSLHLHSFTSTRNFGHIYSASGATGVIMGVGNVGPYLLPYDQCDTFLSYDGGLTWKVVKIGAHLFEFSDSGSILVMVDDEQPTDRILYSYDRGDTWNVHELKSSIRAKLLTSDPKSTTKKFLLLGSIVREHGAPDDGGGNNKIRYQMFQLDFSNLFDRDCNDNDFENWVARKLETGVDCLMGKKSTYRRRKKDARCLVSREFKEPMVDHEICPCAEEDFECDFDYNYVFDKPTEKCILSKQGQERIPDGQCKNGETTYLGSSGYHKIPGNDCDPTKEGSVKHEPVQKQCSEGHSGPPSGEVSHRTIEEGISSYFYFPNSQILMVQTNDGKIKRSKDEGTSWSDVLSDAKPIIHMSLHDHDQKRAYFFSDNPSYRNYMWYTTDRGENFEKTPLLSEPNKLNLQMLDFHPKNPDWLLFMASTSCPGCHSITYFSSDNGKNWKEVESWAEKCVFGRDTEFQVSDDIIFCSSYKDKNSKVSQDRLGGRSSISNPLQFVKKNIKGGEKVVLFGEDVITFFIFNEFMAVAKERLGQLVLYISKDGKDFEEAVFPPDINVDKQAYTLLPSTTGSVFLDSYKSTKYGSEYGSLFKSNSNGTAFDKILDNTNRDSKGYVDFEKVQGLDGIILSNQVTNIDELGRGIKKKVITQISYDDGFRWKRLKNVKHSGTCNGDCSLHLHGRTDINGPGGIFSAPSATGLMIGVGNVGPHLLPYTECNTFISRNGGSSWTEIRRGASLYEFGDQGTIIVVVDDKVPTDHVLYSWNYGKDWKKYIFTSTSVRVDVLTTNSNSTSMKFLLHGYTALLKPVVVTIDFSQLQKRKCVFEDDFELWEPVDPTIDSHQCLLGERIRYWRRKADIECQIGDIEYKSKVKKETCPCTKHDFECAFGYWHEGEDCVLKGHDPKRPSNCQDKYIGHSGYIKVEKSKCKGGDNLDENKELPCNLDTVVSTMKLFDSRIVDYFYFNNTENMLVRTMDFHVWKSINEGYSWESIGALGSDRIIAMFQNVYFDKYAYFITYGKKHYYTDDSGDNIKSFEVPADPNFLQIPVLDFHPTSPGSLIYTGGVGCEQLWSPNCHAVAYYTTDFGNSWKELNSYVKTCSWARDKNFKASQNLIFCESYLHKEGSQVTPINNPLQLVSSTDFFKNQKVHFANTVGFVVFEEFMAVAELLEATLSIRLWISVDAENFAEAQFPKNMAVTRESYTVLESITHSVNLHVTTTSSNKFGNILRSNENGTYYTLSLLNANRDERGLVDFEKMQGIRGIALANIVSNPNEVVMGNNKKLKSMITLNDGSTWSLLKPPEKDSGGRKYKCNDEGCSLHLHSYTERRNPRDSFSSSSAIGLMIGVGNVGQYLTPYLDGDTFLTRDAGATWMEVKKGAYMYEFGDQGGILVLVDDERETDRVFYSLNQGSSWQEYKFIKSGENPIRVFDIDTKPGGLSSKFILHGLYPSDNNKEVIVHLDFRSAFNGVCDLKKDFEPWSPRNTSCLFGREITYQRRMLEKECFIEDNTKHLKKEGNICKCTKDDFECAFNYMRNEKGECVLVSPDAKPLDLSMAEQCANGKEFWYDPSPYRRLEITTCEGGASYAGESHRCPGRHSALFWIIIVLSPFVIVGILTICFINRRHGRSIGQIRLGSPIEPSSILSSIVDIFYQIRIPRFVSRLWSKIPLPGLRGGYRYSPVATDDGVEVLMDDYDQDNETL